MYSAFSVLTMLVTNMAIGLILVFLLASKRRQTWLAQAPTFVAFFLVIQLWPMFLLIDLIGWGIDFSRRVKAWRTLRRKMGL